jgi:hypothetical protein
MRTTPPNWVRHVREETVGTAEKVVQQKMLMELYGTTSLDQRKETVEGFERVVQMFALRAIYADYRGKPPCAL